MKKFLMTLAAAVMAIGVNAQVFVGGSVGFSNDDNGNDDVTSYKFLPEVGYTFNDEWAAGLAFGWSGSNKGYAKQFSVNPYARYTFVNGKVVNVFVDGGLGYTHIYNGGLDIDDINVGLKPGVAVKLGDHLSFVTHIGFIGYSHQKNNNSKDKTNTWEVDIDGNNILFGLYYSF